MVLELDLINTKRISCSIFTSLLLGCVFIFTGSVSAATFTVDSTGDEAAVDASVSCDTSEDTCTLRAAIEAANAQAGADAIEFNIAGSGLHTITPASEFPYIDEQLTIDGTTQTGASCGTLVPSLPANSNIPHTLLVEIDGTAVTNILTINATDSIVRGLTINSAASANIQLDGSNSTIECNYIGTNAAGTAAALEGTGRGIEGTISNNEIAGLETGVSVSQNVIENNLIGTNAAGTAAIPNLTGSSLRDNSVVTNNVISGNGGDGLVLESANSAQAQDNFIGVDLRGNALGNANNGILIRQSNGTTSGFEIKGNVVSANDSNGIEVVAENGTGDCAQITHGTFTGNIIGGNIDGAVEATYGNGASGISINENPGTCGESIFSHQIGGAGDNEPNTIVGNDSDGIRIFQYVNPDDSSEHTNVFSISVLKNKIYSNGGLGINLAVDEEGDGSASEDLGANPINSLLLTYPAEQANNYINSPVIVSAEADGDDLTVTYDFIANSVEDSPDGYSLLEDDLVGYQLDFYVNDGQDGSEADGSQAKVHIGSFIIDSSEANATHTFEDVESFNASSVVTATATVLWTTNPGPATQLSGGCLNTNDRVGDGPPYGYPSDNCSD